MSVEVAVDTPLAQALNAAIQPKLVEVGWSTADGDASALAEYIILMLANGKTQDQIAAELSGDLLNLGPDDPGARDFSVWLFQQVQQLNSPQNGGDDLPRGGMEMESTNDESMGGISESADASVPTGPKSMRNGNGGATRPRDKRMLGHLAKAMDRTHDSVLHRVRPQNGNERINTHARGGAPTGPRQQPGKGGPRMMNGRGNGPMGTISMPQGAAANINMMNMSPQQQLDLYAMMEQQSRLIAQMLGPNQQMPMGNGHMNGGNMNRFQQQQPGRSLFDRVQAPPRNNNFRKGPVNKPAEQQPGSDVPSSSMDVEMSQEKKELDPENTTCRFNLSCTNKDCAFAHQSPAAPPGTTIDYADVCSFGATCKNRKCTGKHPSPAQKIAHQIEMDCKFFPNCTNSRCPFRHPSMPLCRNGADCTTPNCKFTHVATMCKFNPCLNPACTFKHVEGQKRGKFEDKVWTAGGANGAREHVSERRFVDENAAEELIVPETSEGGISQVSSATAELIT